MHQPSSKSLLIIEPNICIWKPHVASHMFEVIFLNSRFLGYLVSTKTCVFFFALGPCVPMLGYLNCKLVGYRRFNGPNFGRFIFLFSALKQKQYIEKILWKWERCVFDLFFSLKTKPSSKHCAWQLFGTLQTLSGASSPLLLRWGQHREMDMVDARTCS